MTFEEIVDQAIAMVRRRGQVSYRLLKRQFALDEAAFEDLKDEILYAHSQIVDDAGRGFAWTGDPEPAVASPPSVVAPVPATGPTPSPLSYTPHYLTEKILTSRSALEGERKQVTILFADLKDSTELIKDLDPEDAQKLLDPAIHIMMEGVHRFEGTVNQVLGDGLMALFGAPIAHEDHALRACYAALAMQAAMQEYTEEVRRTHGIEMRIRVGLNSGEVVVRTIGNDLHMDYSAVGQATHLAARMEQLATPGTIRLTAATLRLVEGLVRVNALGPVPVKGMTEPVDVFELVGVTGLRRRLQAAVAQGLTKFVGRESAIEALHQARERAEAGHGQIVAAVGEAGVGKSRLVYEFVHSHHTQGWLVLESASVSYGKATPYFPVIDLLKRYVHVEDGEEPRTVRAKVTGHIFTLDETLQATIPVLLSLLDALPEDSPFLQLDPPQRRQRTLDGLKRILLRESRVQPLLLVFEDLHWIDSETQALLDNLVESLPTAQLFLIVNYRPEYQHTWGSKTYYTQLRLDPLSPESADEFLAALIGNDTSLEPLKKLLIERTEGNPFFLEESVRTLVETGMLTGEPGAYQLAQALLTIQVPPTVQAVLAARIDRLPQDDKRLLQTAAVIGTEVPLSLLQAIAELSEDALHRGLAHLQAAEFLYETILFPERAYTFKRALAFSTASGDVTYQAQTNGFLGQIYFALGDYRRARDVFRRTMESFEGEELFGFMLGSVWSRAWLAHCCEALGAFAEGIACGEDAARIAEAADNTFSTFYTQYALGCLALRKGDLHQAIPQLERALAGCHAVDLLLWLPLITAHLGLAYALSGRIDEALPLLEQVAAQRVSWTGGRNVPAIPIVGEAFLLAGRLEDASNFAEQALALSRGHKQRGHQAHALRLLGDIAMHCDPPDIDHAETHYRQALTLANELGMRPLQAHCHRGLGILYRQTGQSEYARAELSTAIEMYRDMEMTFWLPETEAALAEVEKR
jgi:class 3 adenylate cyclase/tetratricopeptide (TPR) repeat protein